MSKECLNQKSGNEKFCNPGLDWNGDGSKISDNSVDIEIGDGWQLLSVEEREGKCPGTKEKVADIDWQNLKHKSQVEIYEKTTTGEQHTVVTAILNHQVLKPFQKL